MDSSDDNEVTEGNNQGKREIARPEDAEALSAKETLSLSEAFDHVGRIRAANARKRKALKEANASKMVLKKAADRVLADKDIVVLDSDDEEDMRDEMRRLQAFLNQEKVNKVNRAKYEEKIAQDEAEAREILASRPNRGEPEKRDVYAIPIPNALPEKEALAKVDRLDKEKRDSIKKWVRKIALICIIFLKLIFIYVTVFCRIRNSHLYFVIFQVEDVSQSTNEAVEGSKRDLADFDMSGEVGELLRDLEATSKDANKTLEKCNTLVTSASAALAARKTAKDGTKAAVSAPPAESSPPFRPTRLFGGKDNDKLTIDITKQAVGYSITNITNFIYCEMIRDGELEKAGEKVSPTQKKVRLHGNVTLV